MFAPWHYVPVLACKAGALRNGAPFKDWVLPGGLDRIRRKLAGSADGDRQMVREVGLCSTIKAVLLRKTRPQALRLNCAPPGLRDCFDGKHLGKLRIHT